MEGVVGVPLSETGAGSSVRNRGIISLSHTRKNSVGQFSQQPAKAQNRQVDEETARALVQRVSQLEKESARVQALLKSRDGTLSPNELRALGKLMVFTGAAKDGTEWSFVFEAHSATGSTEVSHGPTLVNKWRANATSCADERDRRGLGRTFVLRS